MTTSLADPATFMIERTPSAHDSPLLLKELLASGVRRAPRQEIVYREDVRHDYRTFAARVARLAYVLESLGVGRGSTVGVLDWDSHRYLECYFAIPGMGAVLHMVNIRLSAEKILYTINHADDDLLLVHVDFLPLVETIHSGIKRQVKIVVIGDGTDCPLSSELPIAGEYESLLAKGGDEYMFPDLPEDTRATTFYTSGTTGDPKGVYFSHRQLVLHTLAAAATVGTARVQGRFDREDVYMPITPMFHVHAWGFPFVATMLGMKQVYPGRYEPDRLLRSIEKEGVTFSHCVPTILHMLLESDPSNSVDLGRWKVILGGAATPAKLVEAAIGRGIDLFTGYGMSETCPIMTIAQLTPQMCALSSEEQLAIRLKAGMPLPLVELRILDGEDRILPDDGSAGEIAVRAPWLTQGYFKDPENSEKLWRGGYLHTGDIGVVGPDGFLKITDRIKDVIKSGGEWVSSIEIEDLISRCPGVMEAAVIGIADAKWGERPLAIVAARAEGPRPTEADICNVLKEHAASGMISPYAVPRDFVFTDILEKTSVGKIDKKALREKYGRTASA
ncbi:fatty acid--CoA ligase [Sphingopyxis sp.]|jgi:fatty-acyl-CoA synthase|uniref:fatty acid--CoA ligase n=1 Tax=Sphingopyxis sp. TaxID=1908224 RepID=UPI002DE54DA4|nr:fatty acid--CoA ligase [Sphingopyxis sp.]